MKKNHWVNIRYDFNNGDPYYIYNGLVTGLEENNKVYIDVVKLFKNAFKREWIGRCTVSYG